MQSLDLRFFFNGIGRESITEEFKEARTPNIRNLRHYLYKLFTVFSLTVGNLEKPVKLQEFHEFFQRVPAESLKRTVNIQYSNFTRQLPRPYILFCSFF